MVVYVITCIPNGKRYVGKTVSTLEARWWKHCYEARKGSLYFFHQAIRKYGPENFELRILLRCENFKQLKEGEKKFIKFYKSNEKEFGYNLTEGGDGCEGLVFSDEHRHKIGESNKKFWSTMDQSQVTLRVGCWFLGREKHRKNEMLRQKSYRYLLLHRQKLSNKTEEIMEEARKAELHKKQAKSRKIVKSLMGVPLSEEHCLHISNGHKRYWDRQRSEAAAIGAEIKYATVNGKKVRLFQSGAVIAGGKR